jgi:hypothetical protein
MPKKRAITSRKAAKPKAPTKPAESTPEPDDELIRIEKAKHAAMCCLHSVARFVVASGRTLKGPKFYRVGINEELEAGLCHPPHQVLVEPLREAIKTARECLKPIIQFLPHYGNGEESRQFDPYANNYHELAYRIADDLARAIYVEDRGLDESGFQSGPETTEDVLKRLETEPGPGESTADPYSAMANFVLAPFHKFVRDEWRFRELNHEDLRSRLSRESEGMERDAEAGKKTVDSESVLFHPPGTEPPAKYRRGQKDNGDPIGPVIGTKEALGFALHRNDSLSVQAYTQLLRRRLESGMVWAREGDGKGVEMFVTNWPDQDRYLKRVELFSNRNK